MQTKITIGVLKLQKSLAEKWEILPVEVGLVANGTVLFCLLSFFFFSNFKGNKDWINLILTELFWRK